MAATRTIVGRDAELERLREVVQGDVPPFVAFVEGEAGIGKTRCSRRSPPRQRDRARWCCGHDHRRLGKVA